MATTTYQPAYITLIAPNGERVMAQGYWCHLRDCVRWRGTLPRRCNPRSGWQAELHGQRYRVVAAIQFMPGAPRELDLEEVRDADASTG